MLGMNESPVADAIAQLGGAAAVSRRRELKSPWSVSKWIRDGLPAEHVLWLASQTDWKFTPHQLAPRLYPHPNDGLPSGRRITPEDAAA